MMRIGILALQGAFAEHGQMLSGLGVEHFEIRQARDIGCSFDGLIIPGGESTVIGKLLRDLSLFEPIAELIASGFPVYGTCAGLILLAGEISNDRRTYFRSMDMRVRRNAYGKQLGSFEAVSDFAGLKKIKMVFIRAPYIEAVWGGAKVLAETGGRIVAARQGKQLVTAFHPELTDDGTVHMYFLDIVEGRA